jgi:Tol biopolymer transport system component
MHREKHLCLRTCTWILNRFGLSRSAGRAERLGLSRTFTFRLTGHLTLSTIHGMETRFSRSVLGKAALMLSFGLWSAQVIPVFAQPSPEPVMSENSELVRALAAEVRDLGWIGYSARTASGDWDLFCCRPDGSQQRNLTKTPDFNEFSPQWSRDHQHLLFRRLPRTESIDSNRHGEQGELILANRDASEPRVLGQAGGFPWASWSPDSRQIACLALKGISLVDLNSLQAARNMPRKGFFQQMVWSPDGRWLVGVANSYGTGWSIARLELSTGEASPINRVDCCTPDWFPDARQVIFSWRPPGQTSNRGYGWTQLWRAAADSSTRQLVYAEEGRHVYGGHVSPDGRYVLFTGNMEEDGDPGRAGAPMALMRLRDGPIIGGKNEELRARHPDAKSGPVLTLPAGWEPCWILAVLSPLPPASGAKPDETQSAALANELRTQGWLAFSTKTDAGDWDLFRMRPDGSARTRLTDTREFNEAGARFSPDGTRLLYYRMPKSEPVDNNNYGTFDLVIANANGTAPMVFGPGYPWASWSPDGRQLACLTPKGIQMIDLASRTQVRSIPRRGIVSQLVWSPDGKFFCGTANGLGPFWNIGCLGLETGQITAVSETERYNCTPDWVPGARHIVYARGIIPQQQGHAELWEASADGSERRPIYVETGHHIYGACASPNGKFVLFTRSVEDLGKVADISMAIIRWPAFGQPTNSPAIPRLDLGPGWEPHWTATEIIP